MTKSELVRQEYTNLSDQDRRTFDRWLRANMAIASLFCAALFAMALAHGLYTVGPRIATAESSLNEAALIKKFPTIESAALSSQDLTASIRIAAYPSDRPSFAAPGRRTFAKECASRDLQTYTNIEEYGLAGTVPAERLAAAYNMLLNARDQCGTSEADGIRAYNAIDLTFTEATAK